VNPAESLKIALRALMANKGRAILTMLGVIIGVFAVIMLVSIGSGVEDEVTGQIEGLGSNLLFVFPADFEEGGGGPGGDGFTADDVDRLERRLEGAEAIVPVIQGGTVIKSGNRTMRSVIAAGNEHNVEVFNADFEGGRNYTRSEVNAASKVVVLGASVRDELFGTQDPVGRAVTIDGRRFEVIGHTADTGGGLGGDQDNQLYMPYTTAMRLLGVDEIGMIAVKATDAGEIELVKMRIERILEPRFGDDLTVYSQEQMLGILSTLLGTLTYMLAGIAGISLLVGGIGIMNIMLVSVSERTREIGIRKAVGARTYDIMSQFVIEAVMLSVTGGAVGIALGALGSRAISPLVPAIVTPWAVAMAFFFAAGVGIFFGVYPAWKASKLDPIEALRYE
jgi:putative ABC transport system permease protein